MQGHHNMCLIVYECFFSSRRKLQNNLWTFHVIVIIIINHILHFIRPIFSRVSVGHLIEIYTIFWPTVGCPICDPKDVHSTACPKCWIAVPLSRQLMYVHFTAWHMGYLLYHLIEVPPSKSNQTPAWAHRNILPESGDKVYNPGPGWWSGHPEARWPVEQICRRVPGNREDIQWGVRTSTVGPEWERRTLSMDTLRYIFSF